MDDYTLYHYRATPVDFCNRELPTQHAFVCAHEDTPRQLVDDKAYEQVSVGSVSHVKLRRSPVEATVVNPPAPTE